MFVVYFLMYYFFLYRFIDIQLIRFFLCIEMILIAFLYFKIETKIKSAVFLRGEKARNYHPWNHELINIKKRCDSTNHRDCVILLEYTQYSYIKLCYFVDYYKILHFIINKYVFFSSYLNMICSDRRKRKETKRRRHVIKRKHTWEKCYTHFTIVIARFFFCSAYTTISTNRSIRNEKSWNAL